MAACANRGGHAHGHGAGPIRTSGRGQPEGIRQGHIQGATRTKRPSCERGGQVEEEEVASAPAVAMGTGPLKKRRAWPCSGDSVGDSRWTPAEEARLPRALPVLDRQWTGADPTI